MINRSDCSRLTSRKQLQHSAGKLAKWRREGRRGGRDGRKIYTNTTKKQRKFWSVFLRILALFPLI
jgi:hypothetical protein